MMRQFFYNRHSVVDLALLDALSQDIEACAIEVWDYMNPAIILPDIFVRALPYMVDKEVVLLNEEPFLVGELTLQFQCKDWQGLNQDAESGLFYVYIDGERTSEDIYAENGLIQFGIVTDEPCTVHIEIIDEEKGYMPWRGELEVVAEDV